MELKEFEKQIANFDAIKTLVLSNDENKTAYKLYESAKAYLLSHPWCTEIENAWIGAQWDDILAVFLLKIKSDQAEVDEYIWMIEGDIPPAYIDIESAPNIKEAIECYIFIMNDWVEAVQNNDPLDDCYPIEVFPTQENAEMLEKRLRFIEERILPELE